MWVEACWRATGWVRCACASFVEQLHLEPRLQIVVGLQVREQVGDAGLRTVSSGDDAAPVAQSGFGLSVWRLTWGDGRNRKG